MNTNLIDLRLKKTTLPAILALFISLCFQQLQAQERHIVIEKNVNSDARGLYHDLNETRDSLILRSDSRIGYVYSINDSYDRELNYFINDTDCKIPLKNLSFGKHVVVVSKTPLKIVFVVRVHKSTALAVVDGQD